MEVQRESLPGPSTLASASAGSTQDDCEYAESIDSDEHDLENEGSRSSEPVITAASISNFPLCYNIIHSHELFAYNRCLPFLFIVFTLMVVE